jgi:hypothetical protein
MLLVETLSPDQQPPNPVSQAQIDPQTGQPIQVAPQEDGTAGYDEGYDEEGDLEGGEGMDEESFQQPPEPPEVEPLKKYYLIQKITDLRAKLQDQNIRNQDLDNVLKFTDNLSYMTLLGLTNALLPDLEETITRLNNEKPQPKQEI